MRNLEGKSRLPLPKGTPIPKRYLWEPAWVSDKRRDSKAVPLRLTGWSSAGWVNREHGWGPRQTWLLFISPEHLPGPTHYY